MAKTPKKEKGIYLRGKIYWISYADMDGKICRQSTGQKNKEIARKMLESQKTLMASGNQDAVAWKKGKQQFSGLCDLYDTLVASAQESYSTKKYYIQQLKGVFGDIPLNDISLQMLELLMASMQGAAPIEKCPAQLTFVVSNRKKHLKKEIYSPSAINRLISCFKHMMTKAADWGYGKELRSRFITLKKLKEMGRTENYTAETCSKLIASAKTVHHRVYVMIGLNAGPRDNEAMHLQWGDIDFAAGTITFQPDTTKTSDHRVTPMSAPLQRELQEWYDSMEKKPGFKDWLFRHENTGERIKSFRKAFVTMCRSVGIATRYHALRHTFASRLAGKKVHVKLIAELLGDTPETAMRYIHHDVSQKKGAIDEIGIGCETGLEKRRNSKARIGK